MKLLKRNIDITSLSNFKTKASANYYYEINNENDLGNLSEINKFSKDNNLKILFIGGGTNLLFAFNVFDGIVIKNSLNGWNFSDQILNSYSNVLISDIAYELEHKYNENIWHRFIGLPGSVGGAVYGNAGCFGLETESNFLEAHLYNLETGQVEIFNKNEMEFSYRSSFIKNKSLYFIIKVVFDLSSKIEKYHSDVDNLDFRENKQPKGNTCGSFFKNPSKENSAGSLIESVGLKGFKIGGAFFSPLHANFLMNDGTGTYNDLLELISLAQNKVKMNKGFDLVPEVRIIFN